PFLGGHVPSRFRQGDVPAIGKAFRAKHAWDGADLGGGSKRESRLLEVSPNLRRQPLSAGEDSLVVARPYSLHSAPGAHSGRNGRSFLARRGFHTGLYSGFGGVVVRNAVAGAVSPLPVSDCSFFADQSLRLSLKRRVVAANVHVKAGTTIRSECINRSS